VLEQPFGASYWAFSFGVTSLAGAALRMIQRGDAGPVLVLAPLLFAVANVTIAVLAVGTIRQWARGRLLSAPSPAPH
jgi:tellurite resistance protein